MSLKTGHSPELWSVDETRIYYIIKGLLLIVGIQEEYINRGLLMLSHEYGLVSLWQRPEIFLDKGKE